MKKSDKKLDNELRKSLSKLCENYLESVNGFQWLTHQVNYSYLQSLKVTCVFDSNDNLDLLSAPDKAELESQISKVITSLNIKLKKNTKLVEFDTEENCAQFNNGNWAKRLG